MPRPSPGPQRVAHTWFPREHWERAVELWPDFAEGFGKTYEEYCQFLERQLQVARSVGVPIALAPVDVDEYVAWCEEHDRDPETSRSYYAADLSRMAQLVAWPPARNQPCWCGSGRKYKQCCGTVTIAPFDNDTVVPFPDDGMDRPFGLTDDDFDDDFDHLAELHEVIRQPWGYVRVELLSGRGEMLDPPPGRRFLVAPFHDLCDLSQAIDRAFGRWDLSHLHLFELGDGTRLGHDPDPDLEWEDEHDHEVLALGDAGTEFTYTFDLGDDWTHRCVVEWFDDPPDMDDDDIIDQFDLPVPVFGWGSIPDQYGRTIADE